MTNQSPVVELAQVRKQFKGAEGPVHAVAGIDLTINQGEIVAFLGPNGAGKTTTIDMILGLTEPTSGTIRIDGHSPREAVSTGKISAVLQTGGLLRDLTVLETLRAVASLHAMPGRINQVVTQTQLEPILKRRISKCSGGEQQRVKFALALLCDPDLLILDEPTAGMDVNARREFWNTMQQDARSGRTIIFATHYLEEAEAFAQRTVLVAHGKIIADGPTDHIRAIASGREVSASLAADTIDAAVTAIRQQPGTIKVDVNGTRLKVTTQDSDALAKTLLVDLGATDLEISSPSLESAFVNLTSGNVPLQEPEAQSSQAPSTDVRNEDAS